MAQYLPGIYTTIPGKMTAQCTHLTWFLSVGTRCDIVRDGERQLLFLCKQKYTFLFQHVYIISSHIIAHADDSYKLQPLKST